VEAGRFTFLALGRNINNSVSVLIRSTVVFYLKGFASPYKENVRNIIQFASPLACVSDIEECMSTISSTNRRMIKVLPTIMVRLALPELLEKFYIFRVFSLAAKVTNNVTFQTIFY
jgi:hypothetical protein